MARPSWVGDPQRSPEYYSYSYFVVYQFVNTLTTGRFTKSAGWVPTLHLPLEVLKRCTEEVLHASTLIVANTRLELSGVISSILLLSAGRPY